MTSLFAQPLSVKYKDGMTITRYPQLILIERDGNKMKYSGYTQTDAIRRFTKQFPQKTGRVNKENRQLPNTYT